MSGDEGFDTWLADLETRSYGSVDEAATDMVELLVRANRRIELELSGSDAAEPRWEWLREIIRKAVEFIRRIAKEFGAAGYSIGVSMPAGLNASVDWTV